MPIRVVLVDDHPVVVTGIVSLLQKAADISVVATAATGTEALSVIQEHEIDLAVIDVSLPDMSGVALAQKMIALRPDMRLITMTVHEGRAYVQSALLAGVKGYVLKRSAAEDLIRAVRAVAAGGMYLDPSVTRQIIPSLRPGEASHTPEPEELSPREEEVLRLTAQGFSNKEIAAHLNVSTKSVETYKARASTKLQLHTRASIVRYGMARGWLDDLVVDD